MSKDIKAASKKQRKAAAPKKAPTAPVTLQPKTKETKSVIPARSKQAKTVKTQARKPAKDGTNRGRPALFDIKPQVAEDIIKAVRLGNYLETAAAYAGITKETLFAWLRLGAKQESGPYKDFSDSLSKAMAKAEMTDLGRIQAASETNWQASAWRLERRHPSRWGRKDRTPVAAEDEIDYENLTEEELDHVIATGRLPDKR